MRDFGEFTVSTQGSAASRGRARWLWVVIVVLVFSAGLALTAFAASGLPGVGGSASSGNKAGAGGVSGEPRTMNVLLMGLDGGKDKQNDGVRRSDTLILARVYTDTGKVKLLSIPRDLFVDGVAPDGGADRINSAYAYGGPDAAVKAVGNFTGVPVDHYVAADFEGFTEVVDDLGGVTVQVKKDYLADRGIPKGKKHLNGKKALLYARYRKTPTGDLGRIQRQQQILSALRSKALSIDTIRRGPKILRSLNKHVETDMSVARMISLGHTLSESQRNGGFESAQLQGKPVTLPDGREVLKPADEKNKQILYDFLR